MKDKVYEIFKDIVFSSRILGVDTSISTLTVNHLDRKDLKGLVGRQMAQAIANKFVEVLGDDLLDKYASIDPGVYDTKYELKFCLFTMQDYGKILKTLDKLLEDRNVEKKESLSGLPGGER